MNKVYACIDGLANSACVTDWAAWSALRLEAPLEVMRAYGHSRIRQLIVGSTTTTLLRPREVPVLILR